MPWWWYFVVGATIGLILWGCNPFNTHNVMPSPQVCGRHTEWMFGQNRHTHFDAYAKGRWFEFTQGLEAGEDAWYYRMTLKADDKLMFIYSHVGDPHVMHVIHLKRTRACRWDGEGFTFKKVGGR